MKNKIINGMGYLGGAIIIAAYYLTTYLIVELKEPDLTSIFVRGGLFFIGSVLFNITMNKQGVTNGYNSESYQTALLDQYKKTQEITPYIDKFQDWLDKKYLDTLKVRVSNKLAMGGLKYQDYFNEETGLYAGVKIKMEQKKFKYLIEYLKKVKVLNSAKKVKITHLSVMDLVNVYLNDDDPFKLEQNEIRYIEKKGVKNVVSKILFSVLLGSVGVYVLSDLSLASILLNTAMVLGMIGNGLYSMYAGYFFMIRNKRNSVLTQVRLLSEFYTTMCKGGN